MISIVQENGFLRVAVADQFTLQDYREFEQIVLKVLQSHVLVNLLFDLREMQGYTIDMALEEVRFTKAHHDELSRIAIVSDDQWVLWSAWLNRLLADAEIRVFEELADAEVWVQEISSEVEGQP